MILSRRPEPSAAEKGRRPDLLCARQTVTEHHPATAGQAPLLDDRVTNGGLPSLPASDQTIKPSVAGGAVRNVKTQPINKGSMD